MKKLLIFFCFVALGTTSFADDFGQIKLENKKFVYRGSSYDSRTPDIGVVGFDRLFYVRHA